MHAKKGGKLAKLQRENAECMTLMKTFCLNPTCAVYTRISNCSAATRDEFYPVWKVFVPYYCTGDGDSLELHQMKCDIAFRAMLLKVAEAPTKKTVLQLLYVFAATGWFQAIEKFYECLGDGRIVRSSRVELSQEYKEWKDLYISRVHELISVDREHFTSRGIDRSNVDFSRFEKYQREFEEKKAVGK